MCTDRVDFPAMFFFFNDTATTEIYTLSLHDALPISDRPDALDRAATLGIQQHDLRGPAVLEDRKSTRLNSSHVRISYAVFCLQKNNACPETTNCMVLIAHRQYCEPRRHLP